MNSLAAPYKADGTTGDVVLFIHGWTGTPAHLRKLAEGEGIMATRSSYYADRPGNYPRGYGADGALLLDC